MTSTYYADGQWNFTCQLCGKTRKSSAGVKTWDGFRVCKEHKEVRNPQDLMRGVKENLSVPWTAPEPSDTFVLSCDHLSSSCIAGYAGAGCAIPGRLIQLPVSSVLYP
jgi:hypothetical protein